jgi:peptidyl-prolyl cis-trans isomerase D
MLKIMRSNKFFSVFLLTAITIMLTVAFIFWGIGPKDNPQAQFVAEINGDRIMLDEYYRAYDNEYRRLKDQYSDEEIEKMNIPDRVINSLISRRVLLIAAERAGITVSEKELQNAIVNEPAFQRNGVFDVNVYERRLKLNRLSPQTYESVLTRDMIITKMSRLIGETAELSQDEAKMLDTVKGGNKAQLTQIFLASKSNQVINAYIQSLKRQLDITIRRDLVS